MYAWFTIAVCFNLTTVDISQSGHNKRGTTINTVQQGSSTNKKIQFYFLNPAVSCKQSYLPDHLKLSNTNLYLFLFFPFDNLQQLPK